MKNKSLWQFTDRSSSFITRDLRDISYLYFPLVNEAGLMSSITPQLKGDIKKGNDSFLTLPTSRPDLHFTNSSRNFWVYLNKNKKSWPLASGNKKDSIAVEAGLLYHKIITRNRELGLEAHVTNFVPVAKEHVELMLIKLTNISTKNIGITATSAIPMFCRSADNLRDHRHVTSLLNRIDQNKYGVTVTPLMSFDERGHTINQTSYFVLGIDGNNQSPVGSFPTLGSFIGEGENIANPSCIINNLTPKKLSQEELSGKEALGGLRFKSRTLKPKQSTYFALVLGIADKKQKIPGIFKKYNSIKKINTSLENTKTFWKKKANELTFQTHHYMYDSWLRWVGLQPTLRKIFGCSFLPDFDYGRGGKGWRDLWQDCLTPILSSPESLRSLIISNFAGVRIDGTNATIITDKPGEFISDRNKIPRVWMDHGLWPLFTLSLYIDQTGDLDILFKQSPYFRDTQISRAKAVDVNWNGCYYLKTNLGKTYKSTILQHLLVEHLVPFFNVGPRNNILLENADWNDGLDLAADKGESVAFSAFYAYNLFKLSNILEKLQQQKKINNISLLREVLTLVDTPYKPVNYNSPREKKKLLDEYLESVKKHVSNKCHDLPTDSLIEDLRRKAKWISKHINEKEWINLSKDMGLFNGYYDNKSRRLEGKHEGMVRMTLTGQVFPILSGVASDRQIKKIFKAVQKYLKDKKLGGFRLNTNFKKPMFDLGRAFAFAYGEKENGAIFSHMCVMFSYALYRRGYVKEGFQVLDSLFDLAKNSSVSKIYPNLPEYFNLEGRGMYSYLTGSASWYIMTLLTQVFGLRGQFGDLVIAPKLVAHQFKYSPEISATLNFANKRLNITYINPRKKDYDHYHIKEVDSGLSWEKISDREILIKKNTLKSDHSKQINIRIILD